MSALNIPPEAWALADNSLNPDVNFPDYLTYREFLNAAKAKFQALPNVLGMKGQKIEEVTNTQKGWDELTRKAGLAANGREPQGAKEANALWQKPFNPFRATNVHMVDRKNIFEKIGDGISHLAKEVVEIQQKIVSKIGETGLAVTLAPFKGSMKKSLNKRNIPHGNDIVDIAKKFYKYVVNKEQLFSSELDFYGFYGNPNNFTFQKATGFENMDPVTGAVASEATGIDIKKIIKAIVAFFNSLSGAVEEAQAKATEIGKPLSQIAQDLGISTEALDIARQLDAGANNSDRLIKQEAANLAANYNSSGNKISGAGMSTGKIVLIGLAIFAAIKYGPKLLSRAGN